MARKMPKRKIVRAHAIARKHAAAFKRSGIKNPFALGNAIVNKTVKRRGRTRSRKRKR